MKMQAWMAPHFQGGVRNIDVRTHMVAWPLCKDDTHCISLGGNHRFHLAAVDSFHLVACELHAITEGPKDQAKRSDLLSLVSHFITHVKI